MTASTKPTHVYEVTVAGMTEYVRATRPGKARLHGFLAARSGGHAVDFKTIRCKLAASVPPDATVYEATP